MAYHYQFSVSEDGKEWKVLVSDGEFSNIMHNPLPQTVALPSVTIVRYVKLEATTPDDAPAVMAMEELGVTVVPDEK